MLLRHLVEMCISQLGRVSVQPWALLVGLLKQMFMQVMGVMELAIHIAAVKVDYYFFPHLRKFSDD